MDKLEWAAEEVAKIKDAVCDTASICDVYSTHLGRELRAYEIDEIEIICDLVAAIRRYDCPHQSGWTVATSFEIARRDGAGLNIGTLGWLEQHGVIPSLRGQNLYKVNLSNADLSGVDLRDTDLSCACLIDAQLSRADLSGSNLDRTDLSGSILYDANLRDANLRGANFSGALGVCIDGAINAGSAEYYGATLESTKGECLLWKSGW